MSTLYTSKILLPGNIGTLYSLAKDGILLIIVSFAFLIISRNMRIKVNPINILCLIYLTIIIFYALISPIGLIAFKEVLRMAYAPIIFLSIQHIKIPYNKYRKVLIFCLLLFLFFIITGLIIYFVIGQKNFYDIIALKQYFINNGIDEINMYNLYRFPKSGGIAYRMTGLLVNPSEMTTIAVFTILLSRSLIKNNKAVQYSVISLSILSILLSGNRSILMGLICAFVVIKVMKQSVSLKIIYSILMIFISVFIISLTISNLNLLKDYVDGSTAIHMYDLFIKGPEEALKHWKGIGIGMSGMLNYGASSKNLSVERIHIESDYFMLIIQIGILGFLIYMALIYSIINKLVKISVTTNSKDELNINANTAALVILSVHIAALTFPLLTSRIISTFMWVYTAIVINHYNSRQSHNTFYQKLN